MLSTPIKLKSGAILFEVSNGYLAMNLFCFFVFDAFATSRKKDCWTRSMSLLQLWCLSLMGLAKSTTELCEQVLIRNFFFDVALKPVETGVVFLCPTQYVEQVLSSYIAAAVSHLIPLVRQYLGYDLQFWSIAEVSVSDLLFLQQNGIVASWRQLLAVDNLLRDLERKGIDPFSQQGLACLLKNQHGCELLACSNGSRSTVALEAQASSDFGKAVFDPKDQTSDRLDLTGNRVFFDKIFADLLTETFSPKQLSKFAQKNEEQLNLYQKNLGLHKGLKSFGGTVGAMGLAIEVSSFRLGGDVSHTPSVTDYQQCGLEINDILLPCSVVVSEQDLLTLRVLRKVDYRVPALCGQMSAHASFETSFFVELVLGTDGDVTACFNSGSDVTYVTCSYMFMPSNLQVPLSRKQKVPHYRVVEWHFGNEQVRCSFSVDREYLLFEQHHLVIGVGEPTYGVKIWDDSFAYVFDIPARDNTCVSLEQLGYIYNSCCFSFSSLPVADLKNLAGGRLYGGSASHQGNGRIKGNSLVSLSETSARKNVSVPNVTDIVVASELKAAVKKPIVTPSLERVTVPVIDVFEAAVLGPTDFSDKTSTRVLAVDVVKSVEQKSIMSACPQALQSLPLTLLSVSCRS